MVVVVVIRITAAAAAVNTKTLCRICSEKTCRLVAGSATTATITG